MSEMKEIDKDLKNLDSYTGTQSYMWMHKRRVTEGIRYLMENGYHWFVSDALINCVHHDKLKNQPFITIKLKRTDIRESKGGIWCQGEVEFSDGNEKVLLTQKYSMCDARRDLTLFYTDDVLLLAREY
jgi:hypothetical protein